MPLKAKELPTQALQPRYTHANPAGRIELACLCLFSVNKILLPQGAGSAAQLLMQHSECAVQADAKQMDRYRRGSIVQEGLPQRRLRQQA